MQEINEVTLERFSPFCTGKLTPEDLINQACSIKETVDGFLDDDVIAYTVLTKNGLMPLNISSLEKLIDGSDTTISVKVSSIDPLREFARKDGGTGTVLTLNVEDDSGKCRVVLWDTKLQALVDGGEISVDTDILVVNSRYKKGMFGPELTPGKRSYVKILDEEEKLYWDRLMARKYEYAKSKNKEGVIDLMALYGDLEYSRVDVKATVKSVGELREFNRKDGSTGQVVNIRIYDGTAEAILTLWDDMASGSGSIKIGDMLHIQDGRPKTREGIVEIHSGYSTKLKIL